MLSEAKSFWDAIAGKVRELIRGETQNTFRMERYDVTTAPNGSRIGVTKPFGTNEIFLPYSAEVANATVGAPVLVTWWGSMSNAKVYYYADGYRGKRVDYAIYDSVTKLGLTSGSATIAGAWAALQRDEILMCPAIEFAASEVPSTSGCMVEMVKRYNDGSSGRINFWGRTEAIGDYRMFVGGSPFTPTGTWKKTTYS